MKITMKTILWLVSAWLLIAATGCQLVTVPATIAYDVTHTVALGGSAQPFFVYSKADLKELNAQMEAAGIPVTLAETYLAAYRTPFELLPPKGDTGQIAGSMDTVNLYFHRILGAEGVPNAKYYLITQIETAQSEGWALFALVYRPANLIRVKKKLDPSIELTLRPKETEYYLPYRSEANDSRLDRVIDWAAIPNDCFATQAQQAMLLTLSANRAVADDKKNNLEYWQAEELWLAGDFMTVVKRQDRAVCGALGLEEGFTVRIPPPEADPAVFTSP